MPKLETTYHPGDMPKVSGDTWQLAQDACTAHQQREVIRQLVEAAKYMKGCFQAHTQWNGDLPVECEMVDQAVKAAQPFVEQ